MNLKKNWVLVIVSLFLGAIVTETVHITTGDPNRPITNNLTLLYAILMYGALKIMVRLSDRDQTR